MSGIVIAALTAPEQAFLTLTQVTPALSGIDVVGRQLGFEGVSVVSLPEAVTASPTPGWLHRGSSRLFGEFPSWPLEMRVDTAADTTVPSPLHLVSAMHYATYTSGEAGTFILHAAGLLGSPAAAEATGAPTPTAPMSEADREICRKLNLSLEKLGLSARSFNCLKRNAWKRSVNNPERSFPNGIHFVWQLLEEFRNPNNMLRMKNFGRRSMNEVKDIIEKLGLSFGMQYPAGFERRTR